MFLPLFSLVLMFSCFLLCHHYIDCMIVSLFCLSSSVVTVYSFLCTYISVSHLSPLSLLFYLPSDFPSSFFIFSSFCLSSSVHSFFYTSTSVFHLSSLWCSILSSVLFLPLIFLLSGFPFFFFTLLLLHSCLPFIFSVSVEKK